MMSRALPIGSVVLAAVIIYLYVSPTYMVQIKEVNARITEIQAALDAAARYHAKESELAAAQRAIDPNDLRRLETFIPNSIDNLGVIVDMTALATRSGVQITNINASPLPKSGSGEGASTAPVGSIDLSLSVVGTYKAFRTFMTGIEHSARLLDISSLTITGSDTGVYTYGMTVKLYWLR